MSVSLRSDTVVLAVVILSCSAFFPASGASSTGPSPAPNYIQRADDYWLGRQNLDNVRRGISLLREELDKNPRDYEAWWRICKLDSFVARHSWGPEKNRALNDGITAGKKAVALQPGRVEGHFWLGANEGLLAEEGGLLEGLKLVDNIRREMETVVKLDPDYEEGSGLRTLGRVYYRAPFFKGGDKRRSVALLEECLHKFPGNSLTMLYLADSYIAVGRRAEARDLLQTILRLCPDPDYGPEVTDNQTEAHRLLQREFRAGN
jgi:cytochrome c-type biogenesis protein CcmH/NrfG